MYFLLTILDLKYWKIFRQGKLEVRTRKNLGDLYKWKVGKTVNVNLCAVFQTVYYINCTENLAHEKVN